MAATVDVQELNGSGKTATTITTARFCTSDAYNPGTNYPIPIPSSSYNYSYWKSHCLALSGTFTKINNVKWYTDGAISWSLGTNGEVRVGVRDSGDHGCPDASYQQATGTQGTTGNDIADATNGHSYYKSQTTKTAVVTGYTSGSPLTVDTGDHTTAERTKHVVLQVKVASDAEQGAKDAVTFTFKYDEV